jgi:hypothetical protein
MQFSSLLPMKKKLFELSNRARLKSSQMNNKELLLEGGEDRPSTNPQTAPKLTTRWPLEFRAAIVLRSQPPPPPQQKKKKKKKKKMAFLRSFGRGWNDTWTDSTSTFGGRTTTTTTTHAYESSWHLISLLDVASFRHPWQDYEVNLQQQIVSKKIFKKAFGNYGEVNIIKTRRRRRWEI